MTRRDQQAAEREDAVVREAFAELRSETEQTTPSFESVLARRATAAGHDDMLRRAPLAIAAGLVLVVGVYALAALRQERLVVPHEVVVLSAWRPATDVLLDTPGRDLLRHAPSLSTSLITVTGDFR